MTDWVTTAARLTGRPVLQARLPFGRGLLLQAQGSSVAFRPGEHVTITDAGNGRLEIQTPPAMLQELTHVLRPVAGIYRLASIPELAVQIIKSQIRDREGAVVAEIG